MLAVAITASIKRSALDDAWDAAQAATGGAGNADLRKQLRLNETAARKAIAGGSLSVVSANRRSSQFAAYGPGQITQAEIVEMWRALVDLYDSSKKWLADCAQFGLEPNRTELQGFPDPTPAAVNDPAAVAEADVYAWMMAHCIAITSARSDYSEMRIATGAQYV